MSWTRMAALFRLRPVRRLPPSDAYALWADTYPPRAHNPLMEAEQRVVAPLVRALAPVRALDVGTGTGRGAAIMVEAGAQFVVGIDLSLPMLTRWPSSRARVCGHAGCLPFADRSFDLVCSSLMAGDLEDLSAWVHEAMRVLEPGGHLVYSDFHPAWVARRWRRTFTAADGRRIELAFFPHAIDDHLAALNRAAMEVRAIREPRVTGRAAPVVVVLHATKPKGAGRRSRPAC
jgi:malonyl-CoA O-methyltransferase